MATATLRLGSVYSSLEVQNRAVAGPCRDYSSNSTVHCASLGSLKSELRGATIRSTCILPQQHRSPQFQQAGVIRAGWTRRSKGSLDPPKGKKSWKQRHEKFLKPFILDVFISTKYVHAKVVHRVTSNVVSVATTNAKDLRYSLYSLTDENACKTIGKLLAERTIEADVFAVAFNLRKGERFEGKLAVVVNTLVENGVALLPCFTKELTKRCHENSGQPSERVLGLEKMVHMKRVELSQMSAEELLTMLESPIRFIVLTWAKKPLMKMTFLLETQ